jgi:hypothetical protein
MILDHLQGGHAESRGRDRADGEPRMLLKTIGARHGTATATRTRAPRCSRASRTSAAAPILAGRRRAQYVVYGGMTEEGAKTPHQTATGL